MTIKDDYMNVINTLRGIRYGFDHYLFGKKVFNWDIGLMFKSDRKFEEAFSIFSDLHTNIEENYPKFALLNNYMTETIGYFYRILDTMYFAIHDFGQKLNDLEKSFLKLLTDVAIKINEQLYYEELMLRLKLSSI